MKYGLSEKIIEEIQRVFSSFHQIEKAILFGSRAKGNYKKGSDIDLTLHGKELTLKTLYKIENELDDLLHPYTIDLSIFDQISNPEFIEHIQRVGIIFYERSDFERHYGVVMKKGWEEKKIGEVMEVMRGGSPRPIKKYLTESPDGINWIKIADATASTKYIYKTKQKITKDGLSKTRMVYEGDFLLSNSMSFGRPYIMKTTGCIHDGWLVLRNKPEFNIKKDFLYHLLSSPYVFQQFDNLAAGSTVRNLNISLVSSVKIPIPPLPEQKRIVALLDETFAALDKAKTNAERNLVNAREVFDAVLQGIDAKKEPLGNLVDIKTGKLNANAAVENGEYPFFTCAREVYAIDKYAFDCEAILLAGNNASGDFNVKRYAGKFNAYQRTYVITVNQENQVLYRWLYFQLLNSLKEFKNQSVGANTKFLKLGMIKNMPIAFPSIEEQRTIVAKLDALSAETKKLEEIYERKLVALEELRRSVLQKAFAGEL